jgi:PTS system nitrogen regulatory IIA component
MQSRSEFRRRVARMPVTGEDDACLSRWLQPEKILPEAEASDMAGLFDIAAAEIARTHGLDAGPVRRALERREQAESTALGNGFAIPHARIAGIDEPLTLLIRLAKGIDARAPDGAAVDYFLFIMVPLGDQHAHLQLLAAVAQLFSDGRFRTALDAAQDAEAMADALKAGIARIAK